ncbi:MAG: tyrosine-type recombinase/integrase [Collinsella sp.]
MLTAEELAALFDAPDLSCPVGLRDAAMLELFIATGARISELSRLELGDVCVAESQSAPSGQRLQGANRPPIREGDRGLREVS